MRSQTIRPELPATLLLAGLVLLLTSTPSAAQTTLPPLAKRAGSGNTCDFGEPTYAAYCQHASGNAGFLGSNNESVIGVSATNNIGVLGGGSYGALGQHTNGHYGVLGDDLYGAYGQHDNGNFGYFGGEIVGAYGENANGHYGWIGGGGSGALGHHPDGNTGWLGSEDYGVYGFATGDLNYGVRGMHANGNDGILGSLDYAAYGEHTNGHWGYLGGTTTGVQGRNTNGNFGILGSTNYAVRGVAANGWAGYFQGNVNIIGTLSKSGGSFKIDHPLDPANQYLSHSFVESPDMMNVYNGNIITDAAGEAVVVLPSYFEALNRDFRYQLTVIGTFAQAIIAEKIQDNRFVIRTDQPGVEVSWQVTGIRQDRWAEAHRLVVEEAKPAEERGFYLHPALYGQPAERGVEWGRDPEGMRAMQEMPQRREEERRQIEQARRQMEDEHERMKAEQAQQRSPRRDNGQ